jgi:invasion protein IalB
MLPQSQQRAQPQQQKPAVKPQQQRPSQQSQQQGQRAPSGQPAAPAAASAQPGQAAKPTLVEEIGDWRIQCFAQPARACQLSQRQINPANKSLLVWMELTRTTAPKPANMLAVMLPLGFRISPVLNVDADKALLVGVPIVTCLPTGCVHSGEINNGGIQRMLKAKAITTQMTDMNGRTYQVAMSMRGFRDAFAKTASFLRGG